jgi:LysR family glycine cleavage system transcriptional activator
MKKRRLPPLNPLKSFEAAGRNGSFTKAAEELSVSPVAISRQVGVLEEYFGTKLFERQPQLVRLTPAGREFLPAVTAALDLLDGAAERLRRLNTRRALTVCTYPSFALNWLIPRLQRFRAAHPDIEINMSTAVKPTEFDYEQVDVAILFSHETLAGLAVQPILPDVIQPVCSPALLEGPHPPNTVENLRHHAFLHNRYRRLDWHDWLEGAGIKEIKPDHELTFRGSRLVYQAAMDGLGIAIAQRLLVADDIEKGRLVAPLGPALQRASNYCLASRPERLDDPNVRAFRDWIAEEAQQAIEAVGLPRTLPEPGSQPTRLEAINL